MKRICLALIICSCNSGGNDPVNTKTVQLSGLTMAEDSSSDTVAEIIKPRQTYTELPDKYYEMKDSYTLQPRFPEGHAALYRYIRDHIRIPDEVRGKMFSIEVWVNISVKGKMSVGTIHADCKPCKQAIRDLVADFPLFKPALRVDNIHKTKREIPAVEIIDFHFYSNEELKKHYGLV